MTSEVAFVENNVSTALSIMMLHWKPASVMSHAAYSLLVNANEGKSGALHSLHLTARTLFLDKLSTAHLCVSSTSVCGLFVCLFIFPSWILIVC